MLNLRNRPRLVNGGLLLVVPVLVVWAAIALPARVSGQSAPEMSLNSGVFNVGPGDSAKVGLLYVGRESADVVLSLHSARTGRALSRAELKVDAERLFYSTEVTYQAGKPDDFGDGVFATVQMVGDTGNAIPTLQVLSKRGTPRLLLPARLFSAVEVTY